MAKIKLKNGISMNHGQMCIPATSPLHSRNGKGKRPDKLTPGYGMRDVSATGHGLAFVGGKRPLDDEPNDKSFLNGKTVPIHNGMGSETPEHRGADYGPDHGSDVLREAGRLGAPVGGWKK
jgi:hypothetical protein